MPRRFPLKQTHPGWKIVHIVTAVAGLAFLMWWNSQHGHVPGTVDASELKTLGQVGILSIGVELFKRVLFDK